MRSATPDAPHQPGRRHHGLDYLRGLMIIVVVIAHVTMQYQTMPALEDPGSIDVIGENYRDPDRTIVADRIHQVARVSVNPMLFLLAGFSWAFLLRRRGLRSIAVNRATRILIPMVVGWLIAFPLFRYAFALGREVMLAAEGEASLTAAFVDTPITPYLPFASDVFYLAHFWFLYYLLLFYVASMGLVLWLDRLEGPLLERLRALQAAILIGDLRWVRLPMLVGLSMLATLRDHTAELEIAHGIRPDPETFSAHYVFFLAGWMFALHPEILGDLDRRAGWRFVFGLLLAVLVVTPMGANHEYADTQAELWLGSARIQLAVYWLVHAISTWMLVLGMLGLAERWFPRIDPKFAYLAEASFWVYLAHAPIAVFIPIVLHDWPVDADIKMWISTVIVLVISFASYHLLVRRTAIGRALGGRYRRSPRT